MTHDKPCPNCGRCPTCGRPNAAPYVPYPSPYMYPWLRPTFINTPSYITPISPVTSGGGVSSGSTADGFMIT